MSRDIKLNQDKGYFDISFKNGDIETIDSLETALYMSILSERRATGSEVPNSILRRGHFTNEFNDIRGYEIGSKLWLYTDNNINTEENEELLKGAIKDSLNWLIEDKICKEINIESTINKDSINLNIELVGESQDNSQYYNLFINL